MASQYNILNWYWDVQDTNHGTHVFSSAVSAFVVLADATYVAWLAQDGGGNFAQSIDTFVNLCNVFDTEARTRINPNSAFVSTAVDYSMTNPPITLLVVEMTASGKKVILPPARYPNSFPIGFLSRIKNSETSTNSFDIYRSDWTTFIATLQVGDAFDFALADNATTSPGLRGFSTTLVLAESTFTPAIAFGGGTTGITYSSQTGKYRKIGRLVFFTVFIVLTSKGSSTGEVRVTGLPFTSVDDTSVSIQGNNLAAGVTTALQAAVVSGDTKVVLQRFVAGAATNLADTDFANNSIIRVSGCYSA